MSAERRALVVLLTGLATSALLAVYGGLRYDQFVEAGGASALFVVAPMFLLSLLALHALDLWTHGGGIGSGWVRTCVVACGLAVAPWAWIISGDPVFVTAHVLAQVLAAELIIREQRRRA